MTPRACTPQTGSYASALNTLAESNGAFATMCVCVYVSQGLLPSPSSRGGTGGGVAYVCIQPLCPAPYPPALPLVGTSSAPPASTHLLYTTFLAGASPPSATEGVAGAAPAPTLLAPPPPAEGSHPLGAPPSSATDVVAGPAPALPAAVSTGSIPRGAHIAVQVPTCFLTSSPLPSASQGPRIQMTH